MLKMKTTALLINSFSKIIWVCNRKCILMNKLKWKTSINWFLISRVRYLCMSYTRIKITWQMRSGVRTLATFCTANLMIKLINQGQIVRGLSSKNRVWAAHWATHQMSLKRVSIWTRLRNPFIAHPLKI